MSIVRRLLVLRLFAAVLCIATGVFAFVPREPAARSYHDLHRLLESSGNDDEGVFLSSKVRSGVPRTNAPLSTSDPATTARHKTEFQDLVQQVMETPQPELVPRLLANNIELITALQGEEGAQIISGILDDAAAASDTIYTQTLQTVELILSFAEDFVQQAQEMDDSNKYLLGKIVKVMAPPENDQSVSGVAAGGRRAGDAGSREAALDRFMEEEKENFTTGFLRHLQGECDRIAQQPKVTPESARLLEMLRMIQARVLEELGQDLGEAALVLGQLMGYENHQELLGVLDAGLTVRGAGFAAEMAGLTEEALEGFRSVPGGADPGLVERVRFIDGQLKEFLNNEANE